MIDDAVVLTVAFNRRATEAARMKRVSSIDVGPAAVGADSQATATDDLVITAGQRPLTRGGHPVQTDVDVDSEAVTSR